MRAFIAVEISEEQRENLEKMIRGLVGTGAKVKFVEPENLHLTLKFLGDISESELEEAKKGCRKSIVGVRPFKLGLCGIGAFPNWNYAKVLWAGVSAGAEHVVNLRDLIDELVNVGKADSVAFTPHVTIGRVKGEENKDVLVEKLGEVKDVDFGECEVCGVKIKESVLTPQGPVYKDVFEATFSAGSDVV